MGRGSQNFNYHLRDFRVCACAHHATSRLRAHPLGCIKGARETHKNPAGPTWEHATPTMALRRRERTSMKNAQVVTRILWTSVHCPEVHKIRLPLDCQRVRASAMTQFSVFAMLSASTNLQCMRARRDLKITSILGGASWAREKPTKFSWTHLGTRDSNNRHMTALRAHMRK